MTMTETTDVPSAHGAETERVVYLLGAGATQGAVSFVGSTTSLVMPGLAPALSEKMRELFADKYSDNKGIERLVNDVVDDADFEHLITFLEESRSAEHRDFAADLKVVFADELRARLADVHAELGERHCELYSTLIDMHLVEGFNEELRGFLSLNYDVFVERALEDLGFSVDFGVAVGHEDEDRPPGPLMPLLKMHGSFGWEDQWPIKAAAATPTSLWIAPGIRKAKAEYPFNAIWGLARELLECDVLRIIGCNLGPNDWDLVSLLFTTMHTHATALPYRIEIIARPETAQKIATLFPYLRVISLLEMSDVGPLIVSEVLGGGPRPYDDLNEAQKQEATRNAQAKITNPFEYWLRLKGELISTELDSMTTPTGLFSKFIAPAA
jgi:hypothetical protein